MFAHSLVLIQDHRGRYLKHKDTGLGFCSEGGDSFSLCTLVGRSNCFALRHLNTLAWVTLEADSLVLGPNPAALELFTDLEKCVAFRLVTGAFLTSNRSSGDLTALRGPLRQDKPLKLFTIKDVAPPPHSSLSWPVRCHLRTQQDGLYLSTVTGKLAANAEVPCCSEELIINLGGSVTPATGHPSTTTMVGQCSLWNSTATHLASLEPSTSQLIMQSQHACTGYEDFKLHLYTNNELMLTQQEKEKSSSSSPASSSSTTASANQSKEESLESAVVCRWPFVKCISGAKPTKIVLELASGPCFIITAHGHLIGSTSEAGVLATSFISSSPPSTSSPTHTPFSGKSMYGQTNVNSWEFEHHGDSTYSIRHTASKKLLYVSEAGALKIDGNEPLFPDSRILFNIELAWTKIDSKGLNVAEKGGRNSEIHAEEQYISGFTIKTVFRLGGKQLCLTALPDGRIATCYRKSQPSRWELFALADREAVVKSSAQPLLRLPAAEAVAGEEQVQQQQLQPSSMRRSSSCQAIMKAPVSLSSMLSTSPSTLPGILEQFAFTDNEEENNIGTDEDDDGSSDENYHIDILSRGALSQKAPNMLGRRCASESALPHLHRSNSWLADLNKIASQPCGWDVRSAAKLEDCSCHSLCAAAIINSSSSSCCTGDSQLSSTMINPEDLIASVVSVESLPDEVRDRVVEKLKLLTAPPAAAKLSFQHLNKAAAHGNAPEWSKDLVLEDVDVEMLPEEVAESYACTACKGSSGLLLSLDPEINPRHHRFLQAMSRRQFGGRRRRHGGGGGPDTISAGLQVAKNGLLFFGVLKILGALMN